MIALTRKTLLLLICFSFTINIFAQDESGKLFFARKKQKSLHLQFKFINNQVIIPLQINNSDSMHFILDTGLKPTLISEVLPGQSLNLNNAVSTKLKGLGEGDDLTVLVSQNNVLNLYGIVGLNQTVYVLSEDRFLLSKQMGTSINGLIGADIFNNFVVEIKYDQRILGLHNPDKYVYPKYYTSGAQIPIKLYNNKPYVEIPIMLDDSTTITAKLLIDSGSSDALWLFPGTNEKIKLPKGGTELYLGQGLNGSIYGKQGRIKQIQIGQYILKNATVSYPDTVSIKNSAVEDIIGRNGSIGAEILRRFNVLIDYKAGKMFLRPNAYFRDLFNFNLSGIDIIAPYPGLPIYEISEVSLDSPAAEAGLKKGDQLMEINFQKAVEMSLNDIMLILRNRPGKVVRMKVFRNGQEINVKFTLREQI